MIPKKAVNIIIDLWPMVILISVVLITMRLVYLLVNKKKISLYKELISLCFIIYVMLLFELVTTSDFESFSNNFIPFREIFRYSLTSKLFYRNVIGNIILFIPFTEIFRYKIGTQNFYLNVIGNIVVFIPFGYFTSYYCKINKKWYLGILIALITSGTIEIIQMGIGRSFDIDDIILNVVGGFLGYLIYYFSEKIFNKYNDKFKNNLLLNFICIIMIIVLCVIILSLYGVVF